MAGADGQVVSQRREDWADWSAWELIGVIREVVALDALVSAAGAVELYAVTADGELKRKINRSPLSPSGGWGGVETVTGWAEPAIALSSWTIPGEVENQAVLLRSGAVHQRWRRAGSADWSDWWEAPPSTLSGVATGLAGSGSQPRQQFIAALADQDRVALRRWTPDEGVAALGAGDRGVDLLDHRADRSPDRDRDSADHRRTGSAVPGRAGRVRAAGGRPTSRPMRRIRSGRRRRPRSSPAASCRRSSRRIPS